MVLCCCPPDEIIATEGDLIAFERRLFFITYFHFAVCTVSSVADPQAIVDQNGDRLTIGVDRPTSRRCYSKTQVVEKTIRNLCNEHGCGVNNLEKAAESEELVAFEPHVIVKRARDFLTQELVYYNVLTQNCEHFATLCRYGQAFSLQVRDLCWARRLLGSCSDFFLKLCRSRRSEVYVMNEAIQIVSQT